MGTAQAKDEILIWEERYRRERNRRLKTEEIAERITRNLYDAKSLNIELRRSNEELKLFTNIAAHDLREPLRRIETVCGLLFPAIEKQIDKDDRELLDILTTSVRRMRILIDDFHTLSSISVMSLSYVTIPVSDIIAKCLDELSEEIEEEGLRIKVGSHPSLPVYPALVEQLYTSLIRNVLSHSSGPGCLIRFTCTKENPYVFTVMNTGSHIRPEWLESIFLPFKRFDRTTEGSGLGLFICMKIVERHGGKIWAESDENSVSIKFTLGE